MCGVIIRQHEHTNPCSIWPVQHPHCINETQRIYGQLALGNALKDDHLCRFDSGKTHHNVRGNNEPTDEIQGLSSLTKVPSELGEANQTDNDQRVYNASDFISKAGAE